MHRQGYGAWGNGGVGEVEAQREQRSTYQSTLTTCPVFFLYAKSESIPHPCPLHPGSYTFAPLLYAVQSLSLTQKGILSSTIGSVVNKKGTHQSEAETSGGERSKFGSNLIRNEADWWRFEEGWWSAQRQERGGRRQRGARGGEPEIWLSIRQMLYMDTVRKRDCVLKFSCSLIILLPFQKNI